MGAQHETGTTVRTRAWAVAAAAAISLSGLVSVPSAAWADDAPTAAAPGDRVLSGDIDLPSGLTSAQLGQLTFYLSIDGSDERGNTYCLRADEVCDAHRADLQIDQANGTWAISGLDAKKYHAFVAMQGGDIQIGPLFANHRDRPIDLTAGNAELPETLNLNVGAIRLPIVAPYTKAGAYRLYAIDAQGQREDVTESVFSGSTADEYPVRIHDFNLEVGTYTLRADLPNGVKTYYNGSKFGTERAAEAQRITIGLFTRDKLTDLDLRDFTDVPAGYQFAEDIEWLAKKGITTGSNQADGTLKFMPKTSVSREAMAAFLYRLSGVEGYKAPAKSPFTDVQPGHKFYTQIMWAYENDVTNGMKQKDGTLKFAPSARITREAMAAFVYRQYHDEYGNGSKQVKFIDIPADHQFAKEIRWMASNGITTGRKQSNGDVAYAPKGQTSREATAAFLHRAEAK